MGERRGCFGRDRAGGLRTPALLGGDLGNLGRQARVGVRLAEPAGVQVGGERLAQRAPLISEVGERLKWPHEARLHLVEATHALAVVLRSGDVARIEVVAVLFVRLHLALELRHVPLLAVLRAGGKPQRGREQRQNCAHDDPRDSSHEREATARALTRCSCVG